jgi:hypothetical protein
VVQKKHLGGCCDSATTGSAPTIRPRRGRASTPAAYLGIVRPDADDLLLDHGIAGGVQGYFGSCST